MKKLFLAFSLIGLLSCGDEEKVKVPKDLLPPAKLTSIDFKYFDLFAGAQELDVNLVTPRGQTSYEVTREAPKLELGEVG